ncbi:hypothetical protein [Methylobacterium sp. 391_Methyba4]|uniref:hypothetical protein n=1 Tax=Methylobacterium sp. 391_Methyba4 TaxID=3038924 RepID=UPI00241C0A5F|nr:hypothetical protein [Methylobacterium sp. 391_Methyba4]WFS10378.1 hypothetical protein P9K36_14335 [Methylobacterium sp. 391_Methyba4]
MLDEECGQEDENHGALPDFFDPDGEIRRRTQQAMDDRHAQEKLERQRALRRARDARYRARLRARRNWDRANPGIPMPPPPAPPDPQLTLGL